MFQLVSGGAIMLSRTAYWSKRDAHLLVRDALLLVRIVWRICQTITSSLAISASLMPCHAKTCLAEGLCSLQASEMPVVWYQILGLPGSKRSVLQQTPHLDLSVVATQLQFNSLKLQLEDQQMLEVSVKAASPLQPLDELRALTGCGGGQNDPFIFSAGSAETGAHFQDDAVGLPITFELFES